MALPCPRFPLSESRVLPVHDPHEGGVVVAELAPRAKRRRVEVIYDTATAAMVSDINGVWNDGAGAVTPFTWQKPGDAASKRWLFEVGEYIVDRRSAGRYSVRFTLVDAE